MFEKINEYPVLQKKGKTGFPKKLLFSLAKFFLIAIGVFTLLIASAGNSYACMKVCWSDGSCTEMEGDCSTVCAGSNGFPTCENTSKFNLETDYILAIDGQAWVVQGGALTPIASNNLAAFVLKMNVKYPVGKRETEEAKKEIEKGFSKFFQKKDNGQVSSSRLKTISKESGLRILDKAPSVIVPDKEPSKK